MSLPREIWTLVLQQALHDCPKETIGNTVRVCRLFRAIVNKQLATRFEQTHTFLDLPAPTLNTHFRKKPYYHKADPEKIQAIVSYLTGGVYVRACGNFHPGDNHTPSDYAAFVYAAQHPKSRVVVVYGCVFDQKRHYRYSETMAKATTNIVTAASCETYTFTLRNFSVVVFIHRTDHEKYHRGADLWVIDTFVFVDWRELDHKSRWFQNSVACTNYGHNNVLIFRRPGSNTSMSMSKRTDKKLTEFSVVRATIVPGEDEMIMYVRRSLEGVIEEERYNRRWVIQDVTGRIVQVASADITIKKIPPRFYVPSLR